MHSGAPRPRRDVTKIAHIGAVAPTVGDRKNQQPRSPGGRIEPGSGGDLSSRSTTFCSTAVRAQLTGTTAAPENAGRRLALGTDSGDQMVVELGTLIAPCVVAFPRA